MGILGWKPEEFWKATPRDLGAAINGRVKLHEPTSTRTDGLDTQTLDGLAEFRARNSEDS